MIVKPVDSPAIILPIWLLTLSEVDFAACRRGHRPQAASVRNTRWHGRRRLDRRLPAGLARATQRAEYHHVSMVTYASRAHHMPVPVMFG